MACNESVHLSKSSKKPLAIKNFKYPSTDLEQFCYLYDSDKYKYAVACVDAKHFVRIKLGGSI